MKNETLIPLSKSLSRSFTLIELIVVIIIVGILAAVGMTQYTKVVERGRQAEAKAVLSTLRSAEIAEYMENGAYVDTSNLGVTVPTTCTSTHYFSYRCVVGNNFCGAYRCASGGKTPNWSSSYGVRLYFDGHWLNDL